MNLTNFQFKSRSVRVVDVNGTPYFVGKDVAECLGYKDTVNALKQHCKGVVKHHIPTGRGIQTLSVIPESDVYRLTLRSKAPKAEEFQDWVCETVLPQIRSTGSFIGRLPTSTELAMMVIERDQKLGISSEIADKMQPIHPYGSIAKNGMPRVGIRRAAFVTSKSRPEDAEQVFTLQLQLNIPLTVSLS